jgi:ornithine cyclodeaminase
VRAYIAAARSGAHVFPVLRAHGWQADNRFSVKSASSAAVTGLKVGSYWPSTDALALPRHSSCILLLDERVGQIEALVQASRANGLRTAAGDALAVDALARKDASRLAVFGAGHQAAFECEAIRRVRQISEIFVVNRDRVKAETLAARLRSDSLVAKATTAEEACGVADIIVTATSSRAPLFDAGLVRPGAHLSCMGADAAGKQEAPPELLRRAKLFCDLWSQSRVIGELQHVSDDIERGDVAQPVNLGEVLSGDQPGRTADQDITVFDSSGLALQDLFLAAALLERAKTASELVEL